MLSCNNKKDMKNTILLLFVIALIFVGSCKKEEPVVTYPNHCVADDFECRKGKWARILSDTTWPDTLEFHSEVKFSNYNANYFTGERQGIIYQDYKFKGSGFEYYVDYANQPVNSPFYRFTTYDEVTEILAIYGTGKEQNEFTEYKRVK